MVVNFNDINGNIQTCRVKKFTSKQKVTTRETAALDGINRHLNIPMGWEGSFEMERTDSSIDDYFHNLENNIYYAGQNVGTLTINETITEANGAVSQYQYTGVVISLEDAGMWQADEYVTLKCNFSSEKRIKRA